MVGEWATYYRLWLGLVAGDRRVSGGAGKIGETTALVDGVLKARLVVVRFAIASCVLLLPDAPGLAGRATPEFQRSEVLLGVAVPFAQVQLFYWPIDATPDLLHSDLYTTPATRPPPPSATASRGS